MAVAIGDELSPDEEAQLRREQRAVYADEAQRRVEVIEAKLAGIKESLAEAKADAKRLRAEAQKDEG